MAKKKKNFEEKLERLEEIVAILDDSDTSLEDMLKVYEEGISLAGELRKFLEKAELKIKELKKDRKESI
jgi:exodeoxyribonuclease VII small subunit